MNFKELKQEIPSLVLSEATLVTILKDNKQLFIPDNNGCYDIVESISERKKDGKLIRLAKPIERVVEMKLTDDDCKFQQKRVENLKNFVDFLGCDIYIMSKLSMVQSTAIIIKDRMWKSVVIVGNNSIQYKYTNELEMLRAVNKLSGNTYQLLVVHELPVDVLFLLENV